MTEETLPWAIGSNEFYLYTIVEQQGEAENEYKIVVETLPNSCNVDLFVHDWLCTDWYKNEEVFGANDMGNWITFADDATRRWKLRSRLGIPETDYNVLCKHLTSIDLSGLPSLSDYELEA